MFERKSDRAAAELCYRREIVCILTVNTILDKCELEICCQRADDVDRVFSSSKDWLHAERPSESTLANSVEILPAVIAKCLHFVGNPVEVRAGLLSKERVATTINGGEIQQENDESRQAEIVTKAAELGLAPEASNLSEGTWVARCPGTNHTLELQPNRSLFYCGYCKVGGGTDKLEEFTRAQTN